MHKTDDQPIQDTARQGIIRLGAMIQERRLTKDFFETEEFKHTFDDVRSCLYSQYASDVWKALSIAGRASSISKPAEAKFVPLIEQRLSEALPVWRQLDDGEDRYYLAKALSSTPNAQIVDLAFAELSQEEAAEKARRVWAAIAFEHSTTCEEFLIRLNERIAHAKQAQGLSVDSLIRRLRRIDNVIANDLATAEKPTGSNYGKALRDFYAGSAIANGPDDRELREESAVEFAGSLARIVRLNFRAASDPYVYNILASLRRWWKPVSPPETFEAMSKKVAFVGVDTLHIFAQRGVPNKHLRAAVVEACGRRIVNLLSKSVANSDVGLPEAISHWFTHGTEQIGQKSTDAIEALSGERLDEYLAYLLITTSSPDSNHRTLMSVVDQVSILMPEEASALSRTASRLSQIAQWARAAARSRNIELIAERGDVVAYNPTVHEAMEDCVVGAEVVVSSPGAVRNLPDRPQVLVAKIEVKNR